jgi:hypothetical protein
MMGDEDPPGRRHAWSPGPDPVRADSNWLALSDDDLLFHIEALPPDHVEDLTLLEVVRSTRHFFVRQEAAKKIRNAELLKDHSGDRHIGQILVRGMTRSDDIVYLQRLLEESRHIEVRKAAEAQLRLLADLLARRQKKG